jgi:hypothetical protein
MAHRAHAPWRKAVLIPFWAIQMFFMLIMIILLGLATGVLVKYQNDGDSEFDGVSDDAVNKVTKMYNSLLTSPVGSRLTFLLSEKSQSGLPYWQYA